MRARAPEIARLVAPLVAVGRFALAWRAESLRHILESLPERVEADATPPAAPPLLMVAVLAGGFVPVPQSAPVVATAAALGATEAAAMSWG